MSTLYIKPAGGIAGDMLLGAILDAANMEEILNSYLKRLPLKNWQLQATRAQQLNATGLQVEFICEDIQPKRSLEDITAIIKAADFPEEIETTALRAFDILAEAEAEAHQTTKDKIHFHEVGAVDTILDICGACILKYLYHIERVYCEPLPMGHGRVKCEHGILNVPAPAVKIMLEGIPAYDAPIEGETVTPTGIALLRAWDAVFTTPHNLKSRHKGTGCGSRKGETIPNILTIYIGEEDKQTEDTVYKIECTVDDMTGEELGFLRERLEEAGATDCYYTSVMMKKNRPGIKITLLCHSLYFDAIKEVLFRHSSTLGFIYTEVNRCIMQRTTEHIATEYGDIRIKHASYDHITKAKAEYEDVSRIAKAEHITLKEAAAMAETTN